jgi:hypothetical protein
VRALAAFLVVASVGSVAGAAPVKRPAPRPIPPIWLGVFDPQLPVHAPWDGEVLAPVAHAGTVRVLAPQTGDAASGEVVVVHPMLRKQATGKVDRGAVALTEFAYDQRDGDDGVIVMPGGTPVAFVAPTRFDSLAIRQVLGKVDMLAGVKRALLRLEIATVDLDGDGKADLASTYGCTAWFDGACQSRGQFVLVRRGARWSIVE